MRIKIKRAQSALEFSILVAFLLFFFTTFFLAIQGNTLDQLVKKRNLAVKEIASEVQDEINLALESSDGYSREFEIPELINGEEYEINITAGMVYVAIAKESAIALPVPEVSGTPIKGRNVIRKENGGINLN